LTPGAEDRPQRRGPLNWTAVRARLAAAQHRLNAIDELAQGAFYERVMAESNASEAVEAESLADPADLVLFRIGDDRYAVDATEVLEVVQLARVTALPGVPAFYRGLITHRGVVFPLVDVRSLIGGIAVETSSPEQAILFLSDECAIAIAADAAESFARIATSQITPAGDGEKNSPAIRGTTPDGVVVLDVGALFADARLVVDDRSSRG
jgi:purine-binding chemotaxis protein CheW